MNDQENQHISTGDIDLYQIELEAIGEFEGTVFVSTDGKHTVSVISKTTEGRKSGLEWALKTYDAIVSKLGTKADMWKDLNMPKVTSTKPQISQQSHVLPDGESNPVCGIHGTPMTWKTGQYVNTTQYHKAGDNYAFWSCPMKNADNSYCKYKVPKK